MVNQTVDYDSDNNSSKLNETRLSKERQKETKIDEIKVLDELCEGIKKLLKEKKEH